MTDNIDDLLEMVRARLGQDRFREALRGLLEQEDQRKRTAQSDARVVCTGVDDKKPDGGEVSLFDDFDIDFNAQKYLIETRCSGALTTPYSAIVVEFAA